MNEKKKILIAEDDPGVLDNYKTQLEIMEVLDKKIITSGNQFILNKCEEKGIYYISKSVSLSEILK